jgi:5-hydroxyisourate hydrolase
MKRISTHVLDMTRGIPAAGMSIKLEKQDTSDSWRLLTSTRTDQEGRCGELLPDVDLVPGIYRVRFDTASYFAALHVEPLYPLVEVTFQVRAGELHFHIPLLLSANGYTTYRGS